jgi:dehydrogenase/reductase SDR family member 1
MAESGGTRSGTVAVVAGAARGIGRGIALVLGQAGATVYVADRATRASKVSALHGTVEDTAEQVRQRGGQGIPVAVDFTDQDAVASLFARVERDHGGLDLLVANAFGVGRRGTSHGLDGGAPGPFWTLPIDLWDEMMEGGVRNHLVAAHAAAPLLIRRRGLLVLVGYADQGAAVIGNAFYDLAMTGISRLARSFAHDLGQHGVTALALSPGFTRTEAVLAALGDQLPPGTDSVEFPGRAVLALLRDPRVARHAGRTIPVADLAREYGFTDVDEGTAASPPGRA